MAPGRIAIAVSLNMPKSAKSAIGERTDKEPVMSRASVYTVGEQPCRDFLRGDADVAALGDGNRRNVHHCPVCDGRRSWCDRCHADHHEHGWESCKPGAYVERNRLNDENPTTWNGELSEWIGAEAKATVL